MDRSIDRSMDRSFDGWMDAALTYLLTFLTDVCLQHYNDNDLNFLSQTDVQSASRNFLTF